MFNKYYVSKEQLGFIISSCRRLMELLEGKPYAMISGEQLGFMERVQYLEEMDCKMIGPDLYAIMRLAGRIKIAVIHCREGDREVVSGVVRKLVGVIHKILGRGEK